jgi:hypothetical protein
MAIIVSHSAKRGRAGALDSTTNKTGLYGGSLGGNKKAGTVQYGATWSRGNMGNFLRRAPQGCCNQSVLFALYNTTRNPVQQNRNGYSITHSGMLG